MKIFVRAHAGLMAFLFVVMAALLPMSAAHAQSGPTITSFSPSSGSPGTEVTVTGSGFSALSNLTVSLEQGLASAQATNLTVVNDTTIRFTIPSTAALPAGTYDVYFSYSP
ncbi:MAG: IPT/TIG domain-containing protein, partial [Sphingomonadaceae bacterium]